MTKIPEKRIVAEIHTADGDRFKIGDGPNEPQLEISFSCVMTTLPSRNRARLTISNLSEATIHKLGSKIDTTLGLFERSAVASRTFPGAANRQLRSTIENGQAYCTVDAGEDDDVGRVFEGSIESLRTDRTSETWITDMMVIDGQATANVDVNLKWPAGTKVFDVVDAIVRSMGLSRGNLTPASFLAAVGANQKGVIARPFVIKQSADVILTEILRLSGAEWWTDRGEFYIVRAGQPLVDAALRLKRQRGELRSRPQPIDSGGVRISSDFRRGLRVGRRVVLESESMRTEYRADMVEHTLHSRGGDFASAATLRLVRRAA